MNELESWIRFFEKGFHQCMDFLKNPDLYNIMLRYIQGERRTLTAFQIASAHSVILLIIDLLLSLVCIWAALWAVSGLKTFLYKKYLWFLLMLNLGWCILLLIFKGVWEVLYFMVLKLEPNLFAVLLDNFTLLAVALSFFVYIWLLARSFGLHFFDSLRLFFVSHLLYLVTVFVLSVFLNFLQADWSRLVGENFGMRPMVRSYIADMGKITAKMNVLSLMRFRVFHL